MIEHETIFENIHIHIEQVEKSENELNGGQTKSEREKKQTNKIRKFTQAKSIWTGFVDEQNDDDDDNSWNEKKKKLEIAFLHYSTAVWRKGWATSIAHAKLPFANGFSFRIE